MRMSHANLHLDTNATLTDTCVRQKVQAAITARQGQTHLNFKSSQPSLEIISNYWYIYDNVCTLLICFHFKTTSFQRHHPIYLQRRVERSAQLLTKSTNNLSADVKLQCQQICMITDKWRKKNSGGFVFTKKGQFQVDFIQAKILSGMEENSAKWMADWSRLTFLSYSCSFLRKLTANSNSQVVSPLALTLKCLIVT